MDTYYFKDGSYQFWTQTYAYNRQPNLIRCKENQAPMLRIAELDPSEESLNDGTWNSFMPASRETVTIWLDRLGEKFGYTGKLRTEDGRILIDGVQQQIFHDYESEGEE